MPRVLGAIYRVEKLLLSAGKTPNRIANLSILPSRSTLTTFFFVAIHISLLNKKLTQAILLPIDKSHPSQD
jgi:hypothetical protein